MKICHLLLSGLVAVSTAQSASFEAPQYQVGQSLSEQEGWQSEDGVLISSAESQDGSQSILIPSGSNVSRVLRSAGISYVDFYVQPEFAESPDEPTLHVAGVELGFVHQESGNSVAVFKQDEIVLVPLTGFVASSKKRLESGWVRLTVRIDPSKNIADLYVNGLPALANLPLGKQKGIFELAGTPESSVFLDSWTEASENPLFPDADHDGMPDAEETALGLNAYGDDRNGDLDGDGVSNILEFFSGSRPDVANGTLVNQGATGSVVYVDNRLGSDTNSGCRSYSVAGDGPKASLKGAMAAASNKAIIVILPGTGIYNEGSRSAEGKSLTIKTVSQVTIQ